MQVLVVEDDPTAADLMRTRLRNLGCQPLIALDAEDGMRVAIAERPALILLDLKLNENVTSGLDLLHQLRADERTAHIPVFIHSIFVARRGDLPEAEALADGFLLKPFKLDDLRQIIQGFMAAQGGKAE
jgi:twitching motility two-component system response regulator PilH